MDVWFICLLLSSFSSSFIRSAIRKEGCNRGSIIIAKMKWVDFHEKRLFQNVFFFLSHANCMEERKGHFYCQRIKNLYKKTSLDFKSPCWLKLRSVSYVQLCREHQEVFLPQNNTNRKMDNGGLIQMRQRRWASRWKEQLLLEFLTQVSADMGSETVQMIG